MTLSTSPSNGRLAVLALAMALLGAPAMAHHSFAMFDSRACWSVKGTVRKIALTYPHTWIWLDAAKPDGSVDTWAFEGADPSMMRIAGWARDTVKTGDKITVVFNPLRDGRKGGALVEAKLSNDRNFKLALPRPPCPATIRSVNRD